MKNIISFSLTDNELKLIELLSNSIGVSHSHVARGFFRLGTEPKVFNKMTSKQAVGKYKSLAIVRKLVRIGSSKYK